MRRLVAAALGLAALVGCEDNEYPFEDAWSIACPVPDAPPMVAHFRDRKAVDNGGARRAYRGWVEVSSRDGTPFPDVWIWQVAIDLRDGTAETTSLDRVPTPDGYDEPPDGFRPIELFAETYEEAEDETNATMTGTCTWGGEEAAMQAFQSDDCDLCFDCAHGGPAPWAAIGVAGLLAGRRRRR